MKKVRVDENSIDIISDFVSRVVHSYEDDIRFEGAYVVCGEEEETLTHVGLHLVYIDYTFKSDSIFSAKEVYEKTGVCVSVSAHPYWMYGGRPSDTYVESIMMGDIIYDRNGNLGETKRIFELENRKLAMEKFCVEPPIQYIKK